MVGLTDWFPGLGPTTPYTDRMRSLLSGLQRHGVRIDPTQSGGFNPRNIAGTNTPSLHGTGGRAYDVNWASNPEGSTYRGPQLSYDMYGEDARQPATSIHPDIARHVAQQEGAVWGGDFRGRSPDPMHFEFREPPPAGMPGRTLVARAGLTPPTSMPQPTPQAPPPAPTGSPTPMPEPSWWERMTGRRPAGFTGAWSDNNSNLPPYSAWAGNLPVPNAPTDATMGFAMPPPVAGPAAPLGVPDAFGGDWSLAGSLPGPAVPQVPPFQTQTQIDAPMPTPPDAEAIMAGAAGAQAARPPERGFMQMLEGGLMSPLSAAGLSLLFPQSNLSGAMQGASQAQQQRQEYERAQSRRSVMDRIWGEAFPGGQPNMQHPLLAGQPPQVAAMIAGLGPEAALPLLAKSAMERRQLEFKTAGDQAFVFDPRTGQSVPVPGAQQRAPEAIRTNALRADASYRSLNTALDDYQKLVEREGITAMPGAGRDAVVQARTNIQLQLKELYNLGVLNGPDLMLMEQMLTDTSPSVGNVIANPSGRVRLSVQRLKSMLKTVRDNAMSAAGQQPQQQQQQPGTRLRYDPATGELTNAN